MSTDARSIEVRRVYDHGAAGSGYRVLVDRLWPRGVAKAELDVDEWDKDIAPSTELRRWYGHDVARFDEFARRYRAELGREPAAAEVERLASIASRRHLVLLTATRDVEHSGAEVLRRHLLRVAPKPQTRRSGPRSRPSGGGGAGQNGRGRFVRGA